jgi:Zn-dependent metalloprotease
MKKFIVLSAVLVLFVWAMWGLASSSQTFAYDDTPPNLITGDERLQSDSNGGVEITWNLATNTASFVRGEVPVTVLGLESAATEESLALAYVDRYADIFGVTQVNQELVVVHTEKDEFGMSHIVLGQVHQGVEVYNALMKIHLSADDKTVVAASSGFIPNIQLPTVAPSISGSQALATAMQALPNATLVTHPKLLIYPHTSTVLNTAAKLAWSVELRDDLLPARNIYIVDATNGTIVEVIETLMEERNRDTYDAEHGTSLPGTLVRAEGDPAIEDEDVDHAHDFAGNTYDYYFNTHGRDSFDDQGATIISTAHYGTNYVNAFWNGTQTVYGDGMSVEDVVAHEWTHALTEHTAGLEYKWQSGALNESFSDMFGTMVDRDDWLMGEDLPASVLGGKPAIRDLANPASLGQPAHTDDWVETCSDNQGVHTNSGITNKAYYNVATAIGKNKAELIFYRDLTVYLQATSSLEDARGGALQSATDLYGSNSPEYTAVLNGFNAVGLDGNWNPPENDCACSASVALTDNSVAPTNALAVAVTLYRTRDELMNTTRGLYYQDLYEKHTGEISVLLLGNADLRERGGQILQIVTPGLDALLNGAGDDEVVTEELVNEAVQYLTDLAADARANGDDDLANSIEKELARIDTNELIGMTFDQAWVYINSLTNTHQIYIPGISR